MPRSVLPAQATSLVAVSFRHYRYGIRDKLLRYKQLVVVVVMLLFPSLSALYGFTVAPLRVLFAHMAPLQSLLPVLLAYQLLAVFWARLQREAIVDETIAAFIGSLPLHGAVLLLRDVAVMSLSSILLFLPLAIAFGQHGVAYGFGLASWSMPTFVIVSAVCAQLVYLYRWRPGYLLVLAATLTFTVAAARGWPGVGLLTAGLLLSWAIQRLYSRRGPMVRDDRGDDRRGGSSHSPGSAAAAIVALNRRSLRDCSGSGYKLTVAVAVAVALMALAAAVVLARPDRPSQAAVAGTICTLVAIMVFLFSMAYATVFSGRGRYAGMLSSMPLSRVQWAAFDIASVQALPFVLALVAAAIWCVRSTPGWLAPAPVVTVLSLGALNYGIYRCLPRHAIILSLLALIVWLIGGATVVGFIGELRGDT